MAHTNDLLDAIEARERGTASEFHRDTMTIMWASHTVPGQWYSAAAEYGEPTDDDPFGAKIVVADWDTLVVFWPSE